MKYLKLFIVGFLLFGAINVYAQEQDYVITASEYRAAIGRHISISTPEIDGAVKKNMD